MFEACRHSDWLPSKHVIDHYHNWSFNFCLEGAIWACMAMVGDPDSSLTFPNPTTSLFPVISHLSSYSNKGIRNVSLDAQNVLPIRSQLLALLLLPLPFSLWTYTYTYRLPVSHIFLLIHVFYPIMVTLTLLSFHSQEEKIRKGIFASFYFTLLQCNSYIMNVLWKSYVVYNIGWSTQNMFFYP